MSDARAGTSSAEEISDEDDGWAEYIEEEFGESAEDSEDSEDSEEQD